MIACVALPGMNAAAAECAMLYASAPAFSALPNTAVSTQVEEAGRTWIAPYPITTLALIVLNLGILLMFVIRARNRNKRVARRKSLIF